MASSFFATKNAALLRSGSQNFSDLISAAPTTYGLTAPQAAAYKTLNDIYVDAFVVADEPATRTKGTVQARNDARVPLIQMAVDLSKLIDGCATVTNQQRVDLGLNVRATPQPRPAPGTCSDFKVELMADGSIQIKWKANNAPGLSGVTYQLWRRFGSEGEFAYAGATGEKKFIDSTIPAGTQQVQYQIRGIRPTAAGAWAQFNVNFGQASSGAATASVVETKVSPKIAA